MKEPIKQTVSILMPAKNAMPFLIECIESILAQSYQNWELVVIDDNSTDETATTLGSYAARDNRIQWAANKGNGIISALQLAYAMSSGLYITRMDADDKMPTDKLELMTAALEQKGRGHVAVGLVQYFSADGVGEGYRRYTAWLNKLTSSGTNYKEIYRECVIPSPCWMMHKQDFELCGGFSSEVYPEDYDLCFRMRGAGLQIAPVKEVLHHWRDHGGRASRNDPNYSDNRFLAIKCDNYLKSDHDPSRPLVIYGAGKKAKWIVKYFRERNQHLHWLTNNPNKIGHNIYGVVLEPETALESLDNPKIIVTIANPEEQAELVEKLKRLGFLLGEDWNLWC